MNSRFVLFLAAAALGGALLLGPARAAHAQTAALVTGLGGPAGFGVDTLPPGDDGSSGPIDLTPVFPMGLQFNDMRFTTVFVNINGNVSFGGPLAEYRPVAFPGAPQSMIAAWWADVDTRGSGMPLPGEGVFWHVAPDQIVVTWNLVGYYLLHSDRRDSFQLLIRPVPGSDTTGDFDIEFRYNRCEWTTGDLSGGDGGVGGMPAQAGYDAPSKTGMSAFATLPGSGTPAVLDLCTRSNVDDPGVWVLHVRSGAVALCGNGVPEPGEECDGPRTPPGFGCTADCRLCGGDSGRRCRDTDGGVSDAATDAAEGDTGDDVVMAPDVVVTEDAAVDEPDAEVGDAREAGVVVTGYGGGGLFRCTTAPWRRARGASWGTLLVVLAALRRRAAR